MKIVEVFKSIQGEGYLSGTPAIFIRLQGCTLSCPFCDSKYATIESNENEIQFNIQNDDNVLEFLDYVHQLSEDSRYKIRLIVITGGEPLLDKNHQFLIPLCNVLCNLYGFQVDFETNGINNIADLVEDRCDFITRFFGITEKLYTFSGALSLSTLFSGQEKEVKYNTVAFNTKNRPYTGFFVVSPKFDMRSYNNKVSISQVIKYYLPDSLLDLDNFKWLLSSVRFKLLYSKENEDDIYLFIDRLESIANKISPLLYKNYVQELVYIMPLMPLEDYTREKYEEVCRETFEFCVKNGLCYSPRLHIDVWGPHKRSV
jgi:hypothetical protein